MIIKLKFTLLFFAVFSAFLVLGQESNSNEATLQEKITTNRQLLMTDAGQAFQRLDTLLKQAIKEQNKEAELTLLSHRCWYLTNKDLKKAIDATRQLQTKAREYRNVLYQATANVHFSNIYLSSGLPDKALQEFNSAINILDRISYKDQDQAYFRVKTNAYAAAGGAYIYENKISEAAQVFLKA